jgi:hypothetical protein
VGLLLLCRSRPAATLSKRRTCVLAMRAVCVAMLLCALMPIASARAEERGEPRFHAPNPVGDAGEDRITVGVLVGYGVTLNSEQTAGLNAFGAGFGARGGYDLDPFYLGVRLQFFVGDSRAVPTGSVEIDETTIGIDLGYDLPVDIFVLRLQLGAGLAMSSAELPDGPDQTVDRSSDDLYLAPGAAILTDITDDLFVGAEGHLPFILRSPTITGLVFLLCVGMRF